MASSITPGAEADLRAKGYTIVWEEYGQVGSSKTVRANKMNNKFKHYGWPTIIDDNCTNSDGVSGVRIFARKGLGL